MSIDWYAFTPWSALAGGALIGLAVGLFALLNGRIAGISGILGGLVRPSRGDVGWRVAFVAGMIGAPLVYRLIAALPPSRIDAGYGALLVAGFLVGIGTRYGAGCTSGHGVCARSSRRSSSWAPASPPSSCCGICSVSEAPMPALTAFAAGLLFGIGLVVSGMANPAKVLGFLDVTGAWDPSLAFVMAGAVAVGMIAFFVAGRRDASLLGTPMRLPDTRRIDRRLVGGSLMFGVGWGIAGFCPGPLLVALGMGYEKAFVFAAAMLVGMAAFELLERRRTALPRAQLQR